MKSINENLHPSGGYWFQDANNVKHTGTSWKNLVNKVREYRTRAAQPSGDPEQEISDQVCKRQPGICRAASKGGADKARPAVSVRARMLNWLVSLVGRKEKQQHPGFVTLEERNERVNVCLKCPRMTFTNANECSSCKTTVTKCRKELLGPKQPVDGRLGVCEVFYSDLATDVWINDARQSRADAPDGCWKKIVAKLD